MLKDTVMWSHTVIIIMFIIMSVHINFHLIYIGKPNTNNKKNANKADL